MDAIDTFPDATTRDAIASAWGLSPRAQFNPLGNGLINRTLCVRDGGRERVLQRLNVEVFRSPDRVMRNCHAVTAHLGRERAAGRYAYSVLELLPTLGGAPALVLPDASWWRMYAYLPDTCTHDTVSEPAMAREAGRGFGAFARALDGLPADSVGEVIPAFHDPDARYAAFERARAGDRVGRATGCIAECEAAAAYAEIVAAWQRLTLPRRIVHNDCKLNNILFDAQGHAACVIDLDTVMPGSLLFDFGDLVRTLVNPVAEDSIELDRIQVRRDLFAALAAGYVEGCGSVLSAIERANLVLGARLITGVMALRFLTDHLDGDRYFRIERPQHNLERARNQLTLFAALGDAADELQALVPAEPDRARA
ncbi:aminoglycoside phosphotransferase family protein [Dokdonella soli]|uniref:Aminoglycoside phosphotransferase family protein n=1 Tax=Dokdonella soli TaxID=529810 RepID=A0ABP3TRS1_9GAMM